MKPVQTKNFTVMVDANNVIIGSNCKIPLDFFANLSDILEKMNFKKDDFFIEIKGRKFAQEDVMKITEVGFNC